MSNHKGLVIVLLIVIVAARLLLTGKLQNSFGALFKAGTADAAGGTGASGGGSGKTPGGSGDAYAPPSSLFGLSLPFTAYGESKPGIGAADQAGLNAFGGGNFAHDFDYAGGVGSPVSLPGDASLNYTYLGDQYKPGAWGHLYGFSTPNGGVLEFPHLEGAPYLTKGAVVHGGQPIGNVGSGAGLSSQYWTGGHLAVITDTGGESWLQKLEKALAG